MKPLEEKDEYFKVATRVSVISMMGNLLLSVFKLLAGLLANSGAMISDAVHSASDVFSTIVVMIGIKVSSKEADEDHQYGHERLECIASILLAVMLAAVGCGIGYKGLLKVSGAEGAVTEVPGMLALVASVISILVKEIMYHYTKINARKINSPALLADAWHHRSDALSSVGALIGIVGARMGYPILDPVASVAICFFIIKAAWDIFGDAVNKVVDKSADHSTCEKLMDIASGTDGVLGIDSLKTRVFGAKMYVDFEIVVDRNLPLYEAHNIAESVHDRIEGYFPDVKHCMVHVNPNDVKKA